MVIQTDARPSGMASLFFLNSYKIQIKSKREFENFRGVFGKVRVPNPLWRNFENSCSFVNKFDLTWYFPEVYFLILLTFISRKFFRDSFVLNSNVIIPANNDRDMWIQFQIFVFASFWKSIEPIFAGFTKNGNPKFLTTSS